MPPYERNPLPYIRRYITTHNTDGESIFLSHAQVPDYLPSTPTGEDGEIALLYATTNMPASVDAEADVAQYDEFLHQPPGITVDNGTLFRLIDLRPGKATPMHRTVSVDYGVIIEGDVDLVLDSGASRHMHRGDVSVQRGTAHSFRNRSDTEWCRMLFVYLPMEKINIRGKDLQAEVYDEGFDNPDDRGGNQGGSIEVKVLFPIMDTPIRRIIAGHDAQGKAYFASDEMLTPYDPTSAPAFSTPGPDSGFGVIQIHRSRGFPVDNMRELSDPHKTLVPLADTKGPSCRILDLPPADAGWFHRTLSLDYAVVLSGTVGFITDGGEEKILNQHDVIVCRGANHEWVNRGKDVARVFVVVVPSKEIVTEDGKRLEKTPAGDIYDPKEEED
ncbi:unnamed protein product [Penicillium viridicatum]